MVPTTLVSSPSSWPAPPSPGQLPQGPLPSHGRYRWLPWALPPRVPERPPQVWPCSLAPPTPTSQPCPPCAPRKAPSAGGKGSGIPSPAPPAHGQRAQPGDVVAAGGGGCLDTGPFVPSPTWLLGMRLSCSQILTQRGEGRLWRGWGWGALDSSALSASHLSDVGSRSPGGLVLLARGAGGAGEGGPAWHPLAATPPFSPSLPGLPAAPASRGEAQGGGGGLEGPWCPRWERPRGSGTGAQMPF